MLPQSRRSLTHTNAPVKSVRGGRQSVSTYFIDFVANREKVKTNEPKRPGEEKTGLRASIRCESVNQAK